MVDINKFIRRPDAENPGKLQRKLDLENIDWEQSRQRAAKEGIKLDNQHYEVIEFLRDYYIYNDWPNNAYELTQDLDEAFKEQGGKRYLFSLFPDGPIEQATRIGGLPSPANVENQSHGTVQ